MSSLQILTVAQMQAAEQAIFDTGITVDELMAVAAGGAAEWIRRIAAGRSVTVLCGPGNNGGDGYVIAEILRREGLEVTVIAPMEPTTEAAQNARAKFQGKVQSSGKGASGDVFVDCLFGSGLSRPLSPEHELLLRDLAQKHLIRVAVDLPSGVESDSGRLLNEKLPAHDVTLALGAWKFAHWLLPARARMATKRLVSIGVEPTSGAAELITKPKLSAPMLDAHKYSRGLCAVVGGDMHGAATLAAKAAQRSGAGYVKLLAEGHMSLDPDLVCDGSALRDVLQDQRLKAVLVGPGLGRSELGARKVREVLSHDRAVVLDADALHAMHPDMLKPDANVLATPHDGELEALCKTFGVIAQGRKDRAQALAKASGMMICAKGPDTVIAAPDGRVALAPPAPSWLSVAGTGDVLAGIAVSRMATGSDPFTAACEAVWLHGEAARHSGPAFTAGDLADNVGHALASCL